MTNTHLLIIDPQNDFCDTPEANLPVVAGQMLRPTLAVPGAYNDMGRLAQSVNALSGAIKDITITLDSHPYSAIERTTFWTDAQGNALEAFTIVTIDDVEQGRAVPRHHVKEVTRYLRALKARGRQPLMVWPVHCVTGTWGHGIQDDVAESLNAWEAATGKSVHKALKGQYALAEHYGAFEAEVPMNHVRSTCFNEALAWRLTRDVDLLVVAGEASTHCVANSMYQLHKFLQEGDIDLDIVLLTDCMSPVPGFELEHNRFMRWAESVGMHLLKSTDRYEK